MGLYELLKLRDFGFPWGGVLGQGVANALVGIVVLQAIELLPGAAERRQQRRWRHGHADVDAAWTEYEPE